MMRTRSMDLLASTIVAPEAGAARRTIVLLHGIYGRGRNWAAIARGLIPAGGTTSPAEVSPLRD